tara:strand:+ start:10037 stop:10456 length:420 start_codon:yes stop_codon:yes gene_type:complete
MSITTKIYIKKNNEECLVETFEQDLNVKITDFKNQLLKKYFPENNYLQLTNINERVYKDYGLLFFELGLLPSTNDNYLLSKFTIPNRTFSFLIQGINEEKKVFKQPTRINFNNKYSNQKNEIPHEVGYVFKEEDFPPLC